MFMSLLIGFLAGVFGGIAGVGGGAVMIPMMVGILKLSQHRASGTSLVTLVFTGIAGTIAYAANGHVDFLAAFLLAVTAISSVPGPVPAFPTVFQRQRSAGSMAHSSFSSPSPWF